MLELGVAGEGAVGSMELSAEHRDVDDVVGEMEYVDVWRGIDIEICRYSMDR